MHASVPNPVRLPPPPERPEPVPPPAGVPVPPAPPAGVVPPPPPAGAVGAAGPPDRPCRRALGRAGTRRATPRHSRSPTLRRAIPLRLAMSRASVRLPAPTCSSELLSPGDAVERVPHAVVRPREPDVLADRHEHQRRSVGEREAAGRTATPPGRRSSHLPGSSVLWSTMNTNRRPMPPPSLVLTRTASAPRRRVRPRRRRHVDELGADHAPRLAGRRSP